MTGPAVASANKDVRAVRGVAGLNTPHTSARRGRNPWLLGALPPAPGPAVRVQWGSGRAARTGSPVGKQSGGRRRGSLLSYRGSSQSRLLTSLTALDDEEQGSCGHPAQHCWASWYNTAWLTEGRRTTEGGQGALLGLLRALLVHPHTEGRTLRRPSTWLALLGWYTSVHSRTSLPKGSRRQHGT